MVKKIFMGLAENIDTLLVKFNVTADSLARTAGVSSSMVSRWRHGGDIRKNNVQAICDYFNLTEDDLCSYDHGLAAQEHNYKNNNFIELSTEEIELVIKCRCCSTVRKSVVTWLGSGF